MYPRVLSGFSDKLYQHKYQFRPHKVDSLAAQISRYHATSYANVIITMQIWLFATTTELNQ